MKFVKILGIVVASFITLVVGASVAAYYLIDLDSLINGEVQKYKPEIERQLGRKVEVGKISTSFLPVLGARIEAISIAPDANKPEDDRPLVKLDAVGFELALWDAIVSGGKKITIQTIYVEGLAANVIQYKGGTLSIQDILDHQAKLAAEQPAKPDEPAAGIPPEVMEYIRNTSIAEIRVTDGKFRLVDFNTPTGQMAESFINRLNVRLNDVRLSDAIKVHVDAAIFADAKNFDFDVSVGPLPPDLKVEGLPRINMVAVDMTDVDVSRIAPYLGSAVPVKIDSALVSAKYAFTDLDLTKPLDIDGFFAAKNLKVAGGEAFDLRVDSKLVADTTKLSAQIETLKIQLGTIGIALSGALSDLGSQPKFNNFKVETTNLDPAKVFAYYPPARASLPPGMKIGGPVKLDVVASGDAAHQTVKLDLNATQLDVLIPKTFEKPAATLLTLNVEGKFSAKDADIRAANLKLDELDLSVAGSVKDFANPTFDLTASTKPFSFDRLARLAPGVGVELKKANAKATGDGKLNAVVKGTLSNLDASLDFALTGVSLNVPGTKLSGDLTLKAFAKGDPAKTLSAGLTLDGNRAVIDVEKVMNKPATKKMEIDVQVNKAGDQIKIEKLNVELAELKFAATGGFNLASSATDVKVDFQRLDLERLADTFLAIPKDLVAKSFIDFRVAVVGNPNKLSSMAVNLDDLDVKIGRSDLKGSVAIKNLEDPALDVTLRSNYLNLNEVIPGGGEQDTAAKGEGASTEKAAPRRDDPSLKKHKFVGRFDLKTIVYGTDTISNFKGNVSLRDGIVTLRECRFNMFDGTFSASSTTAEIWRGRMPYDVDFSIRGLDINKALSAKSEHRNTFFGKVNLDVDVKGVGTEAADLERNLAGKVAMKIDEGRLSKGNLTEEVFGDLSALEKIPGLPVKLPKGDQKFKNLSADFHVKDGKMKLKKPMVFTMSGNKVELDGEVGIFGKLFLEGTYFLNKGLIEDATQKKCKPKGDIPVPVDIKGTLSDPKFKPNGGKVIKTLVDECAKGLVKGLVGDKLKEAEAKAKEEAEKLKKEAEKQKKKAEDKAKKEAGKAGKKAADKAKKALGF